MMKKVTLMVLGLMVVVSLAACGNVATDQHTTSENTMENEIVQIPNPFNEVSTLSEAALITGFELRVPEAPVHHPDMIIQVMNDRMIEVIFVNKANETDEGSDEAYRIRKAIGTDDISGDYNKYSDVHTDTINDCEVTLKGDGENYFVATWNVNGYTYAVDAEENPLSAEAMVKIINAIE